MALTDRTYGIETRAVHAGTPPDPTTGARNMPIYQTTAYVFDDVDHAASLFNLQTFGYIYTRITNPTVAALEERVSSLEGGRAGVPVLQVTRPSCSASTRFSNPATRSSRRAICTAAPSRSSRTPSRASAGHATSSIRRIPPPIRQR